MNPDSTDDARIQRAETLRLKYYTELAKFAVRMGCSRSDAEQVAHDSLVDLVMLEPDRVAKIEYERAWLYGTVRNKLRRIYRDRRKWMAVSEFHPDIALDPGMTPEKYIELKELLDAIRGLPERIRLPLVLRLEEVSYSEIATILRCTVDTAKKRVSRARKELRKRLGTYPSGSRSTATLGRAE